ncbi:hypothetical protein C8R47DRAFT_1268731 [Mycena vitilis]|nr:hypothetical protein C8R47DRAFT_1268731 [Mycena vitilis]
MSSSAVPLKFPRLLTLFRSHGRSPSSLSPLAQVPPPTDISINTGDVFAAGVVVTVICGLIFVFTTSYLSFPLLDHRRGCTAQPSSEASASGFPARPSISTRTLPIAVTVFVTKRSARVGASINGVPLLASVLQTVESKWRGRCVRRPGIGTSVKLFAILPWFTFLFTPPRRARRLPRRAPRPSSRSAYDRGSRRGQQA